MNESKGLLANLPILAIVAMGILTYLAMNRLSALETKVDDLNKSLNGTPAV